MSDDDVHSDYHGVFQVTGTSASDVRFQYWLEDLGNHISTASLLAN